MVKRYHEDLTPFENSTNECLKEDISMIMKPRDMYGRPYKKEEKERERGSRVEVFQIVFNVLMF